MSDTPLQRYKGIVLIVLAVLAIAFYWFAIRPSMASKRCYNEALENAVLDTQRSTLATPERSQLQDELKEKYYRNCLRERGVER